MSSEEQRDRDKKQKVAKSLIELYDSGKISFFVPVLTNRSTLGLNAFVFQASAGILRNKSAELQAADILLENNDELIKVDVLVRDDEGNLHLLSNVKLVEIVIAHVYSNKLLTQMFASTTVALHDMYQQRLKDSSKH